MERRMSRAKDIMTKNPAILTLQSSVGEAIGMLIGLDLRHLPVVDEAGSVVGIVSDRDLRALAVPRLVDEQRLGDFRSALATDIARVMSSVVIAVDEEAETRVIIEVMLEHKIGAVPVIDQEGTLVGIVSYIDVLRELRASRIMYTDEEPRGVLS